MDAFENTKTQTYADRGPYLPTFKFQDGKSMPFQVLNTPWGYFHTATLHWIDRDGKTLPPIACSKGHVKTGQRCLTCHGKGTGELFGVDTKYKPTPRKMIPVFDHSNYRENEKDKKRTWISPEVQIDLSKATSIVKGGLCVMSLSETQYKSLQSVHRSLQNICRACQGDMALKSLNCKHCESEIFDQNQLMEMNEEQLDSARQDEHPCPLCQTKGTLAPNRICNTCAGKQSLGIFDTVVLGVKQKVQGPKGERTEYKFAETNRQKIVLLEPAQTAEFFTILNKMYAEPPSLEQQAARLEFAIPPEWKNENTSSRPSRPYGA